jgi:hypothetical protein
VYIRAHTNYMCYMHVMHVHKLYYICYIYIYIYIYIYMCCHSKKKRNWF